MKLQLTDTWDVHRNGYKTFFAPGGLTKTVEVELFTWEKLDFVDQVKDAFDCNYIFN
jgi:hypothetical protein